MTPVSAWKMHKIGRCLLLMVGGNTLHNLILFRLARLLKTLDMWTFGPIHMLTIYYFYHYVFTMMIVM
jgi:hypothetical protein